MILGDSNNNSLELFIFNDCFFIIATTSADISSCYKQNGTVLFYIYIYIYIYTHYAKLSKISVCTLLSYLFKKISTYVHIIISTYFINNNNVKLNY